MGNCCRKPGYTEAEHEFAKGLQRSFGFAPTAVAWVPKTPRAGISQRSVAMAPVAAPRVLTAYSAPICQPARSTCWTW